MTQTIKRLENGICSTRGVSEWHHFVFGQDIPEEDDPNAVWFRAMLLAWAIVVAGIFAGQIVCLLQ